MEIVLLITLDRRTTGKRLENQTGKVANTNGIDSAGDSLMGIYKKEG